MTSIENLTQDELGNLLNKCWMTHDGMWFFHCAQECGIEVTNRLNKSAIKSLAPFEVDRIAKVLGVNMPVENFEEFRHFFEGASKLVIPDFMNATFEYKGDNRVSWSFKRGDCFAYTGIKRLGVIDRYECGVLHRISCWLDVLGIGHRFDPEIGSCHHYHTGKCSGHIDLFVNL